MKVLIAPDKFKGSLSAFEVCHAIKEGLLQKYPDINITAIPMADGGEGTFEVLNSVYNTSTISVKVMDPLLNPIMATYGISSDGQTAIIEMAKASGLQLIAPSQRNPLFTSSYGTGELIRDALDRGVYSIVIGIGGSATNDAGIGMATALGYNFFDVDQQLINPIGKHLRNIDVITTDKVHPRLTEVDFITLCDVINPLYGPDGAAFVYGPQKGATDEEIKLLDEGLRIFEQKAKKYFNMVANFPGAGAAGGLGAGTKAFLRASIKRGVDFIVDATGLNQEVRTADIVITGEGKLDHQTLCGKVVKEISRLAQAMQKPVVAVCGQCELTSAELREIGIIQVVSLTDAQTFQEQAMRDAYSLLKNRIRDEFV